MRLIPIGLMLGVTAVWGWTFVVVKDAVTIYPPMEFLALRFGLAALVLLAAAWRWLGREALLPGALAGLALALGYWLQTVGLRLTDASSAGLVTGMFVVFTPLLDRLVFGVRLARLSLGAVALATLGLYLLTDAATPDVRLGNLLVLGCALCFAAHIVLLGRFAAGLHPVALGAAQVTAAALLFLLVSAPSGELARVPPPAVWKALGVTALLATCLGFAVQSWVQQRLDATTTALLVTSEPVFAVLFAYWLAGDRFTATRAAGAVAIVVALALGELGRTRSASWTDSGS